MLADSATTERALRCLTSDCMPGNCRRMPVVTILERVWYIPRETATLNFVRYEHPGGLRSDLNFVTEVEYEYPGGWRSALNFVTEV